MENYNQNGTIAGETAIATANTNAELTNNFANLSNIDSLLEASANLDELEPVIQLTSEYVELAKPGETFKGIFIGFQGMNVTNKETGESTERTAVRFLVNKVVKINAGVSLVREIKNSGIPVGTAVQVTYVKKEGNLKIYALELLGKK
jgi:hypothetical protein